MQPLPLVCRPARAKAAYQDVLPECEEILICSLCLWCVALQGAGATKLQPRESANRSVQYDSAMVENFLELSQGFFALMGGQIGFSASIDRIQRGRAYLRGR